MIYYFKIESHYFYEVPDVILFFTGTGREVAMGLLEHLTKYEANTVDLKVVFTDGT